MHSRVVMLVDDNDFLRETVASILKTDGYQIIECQDGRHAVDVLDQRTADIVLLDVDMPRMDGWQTLAAFRQRGFAGAVLMLTQIADLESRVRGLDAGADDFLAKPFERQELRARIRSLLRRLKPSPTPAVLTLADLTIYPAEFTAFRSGKPVPMTRTEFSILKLLSQHVGKPVSRDEIHRGVWSCEEPPNSHTLDTHLWRLRRKCGKRADGSDWIQNIPGIGFKLVSASDTPASLVD